jgi:hypothetical protein
MEKTILNQSPSVPGLLKIGQCRKHAYIMPHRVTEMPEPAIDDIVQRLALIGPISEGRKLGCRFGGRERVYGRI